MITSTQHITAYDRDYSPLHAGDYVEYAIPNAYGDGGCGKILSIEEWTDGATLRVYWTDTCEMEYVRPRDTRKQQVAS